MTYHTNTLVTAVESPPIEQARGWLEPARFGADFPLIDLSQAVPGYPPPATVLAALQEAVVNPASAFYTSIAGIEPLRVAIAKEMSPDGGTVTQKNVAVTAGCNQAFSVVMQALVQAGDEVIMPLPWYFNHRMYLDMLGAEVVPVPFMSDAAGVPDVDAIRKRISARTRAIMLVSPNNPVGTVYPPTFIESVNRLAVEHGIALVIDETYRDFIADDESRHHLFNNPDWPESFIQLYSFSKSFSMTGHRVGSIVAAPDVIQQITKILDCQTICPPALGQFAALAGLEHADAFRLEKRQIMAARVDATRRAFKRPGLNFELISSGAYFAYIKHPFTTPSRDVAQRLAREQNMLVLPGSMFGPDQDAYLRLAFANLESDQFDQAINRLMNLND